MATRIYPLITLPRGSEVERPASYFDAYNVRGEGQDWVDGTVTCSFYRGSCTQFGPGRGVKFPYGLHLKISYVHRTTPVCTYEDYMLHLPEAVARDLLSILEVPSDVDPEYACTFFGGSVSEAQPEWAWSTWRTAKPPARWTSSAKGAEEWRQTD